MPVALRSRISQLAMYARWHNYQSYWLGSWTVVRAARGISGKNRGICETVFGTATGILGQLQHHRMTLERYPDIQLTMKTAKDVGFVVSTLKYCKSQEDVSAYQLSQLETVLLNPDCINELNWREVQKENLKLITIKYKSTNISSYLPIHTIPPIELYWKGVYTRQRYSFSP